MKKNLVSLLSLAFLVGLVSLTSCKKEEALGNGTQFRATMEGCTSQNGKTTLNGTALEWVAGDQIAVYGTAGCGIYSATPQTPATVAVFDNVSGETGNPTFRAFYPSTLTTDGVNVTLPATQTYVEGSINEFPMYAESSNEELTFKNLCGVLKLNLTKASTSISSITISGITEINGTFSVDYNGGDPDLEYVSGGTSATTLTCATAQNIASGKDFYIYLPEGSYAGLRIAVNTADGMNCTKTANHAINITRSRYTLITLGESDLNFVEPLPEGASSGLFSVRATCQVRFSSGNLQYQPSTSTWRFANHQYDYVGADNANISATYSGWIDLFGWGTGSNPTLSSTNYSDYGTFVDWGSNAISNGGNATNSGWRTLNQAEWNYLLNTRSNTTNLGTNDARYAKGKVNNVQGVILFPDGYVHPTDVAVPTGINDAASGYNTNYTLADWARVEAAGAVFLPGAGYRVGANVYDPGSDGYYWSSGYRNAVGAYGMSFASNEFYFMLNFNRNYGFSVRLVRDND